MQQQVVRLVVADEHIHRTVLVDVHGCHFGQPAAWGERPLGRSVDPLPA